MYVGDELVGFVMLSWNCVPQPPEIIGPWFLWKLLIDERHQGRGYGGQVVRIVSEMIQTAGADELLTSCHADVVGSPAPFYERLGFVPTGDFDDQGETILCLDLRQPQASMPDAIRRHRHLTTSAQHMTSGVGGRGRPRCPRPSRTVDDR